MSTVTVAQYQALTGDVTTASALVQSRLDEAEAMVEDYMRRELASQERTERVRWSHTCKVYPKHTPITAIPAGSAYTLEDTAVLADVGYAAVDQAVGSWPSPVPDAYRHNADYATVTYTGGWTSDTLPVTLRHVVITIAQKLGSFGTGVNQPGVQQASVGDVSVTYSQQALSGGQHPVDWYAPLASQVLKPYRWRPL